jgi:Mg2+ and Co2+ transporter CorA
MSNIANIVHKEGIRKMSTTERKQVEREINELEDQLKQTESSDGTTPRPQHLQAVPQIKARITKLESLLEKDDDLIPTGSEKDRLLLRKKELEAIIKKEMPTEREQAMRVSISQQAFEEAVNKTVHHQKKYGAFIQEWQEICRRLEPDDPNAGDTRKLL